MSQKPEKEQDPNAPVTQLLTPVRLDYTVVAGHHLSQYLRGFAEKRILGARCEGCNKVLLPPRGACPTCGIPTAGIVEVKDQGTLTTYCAISIPFGNMPFAPPYIAGAVLLDGADIPIFHLVRGIEPDEVRMGMRLKAIWKDEAELGPTLESIKWFEPSGEPDADYETYKEHL
ncbi:MAG: Zn-ribbon domain-containing OB-fold protein [Myxococcales bacterium]|nr:Zn-ribbon domain-containing OB-fold protein [Myxococcales bacterium]